MTTHIVALIRLLEIFLAKYTQLYNFTCDLSAGIFFRLAVSNLQHMLKIHISFLYVPL